VAYSAGYGGGYGAVPPEVVFAGTGDFTAGGAIEFIAGVVFAGTGTFVVTAAGPAPAAGTVRFSGGSTFTVVATAVAAVSFRGTGSLRVSVELDYRVDVVDQNGSVFGTLTNARVGRYSYELNGTGSAEFTLTTTDPDAYLVRPGREIQIWRNGILQWWGPIVRPQAGLHETTWQCAGLLWYFEHRFMGRADRTNVLLNGDFEAGEDDWTFVGVTHSIDDPGAPFDGTQSLELEGGAVDHNTYATQTWAHGGVTPPGWPGDYMTGSAWVYVPAADYLGGAREDRGLLLIHYDASGNVVDARTAIIDDDTVKDEWIPLEAGVANVKAGETVEVRLYPPHGVAFFDLVTLTFMESLPFGGYLSSDPPADFTDIMTGIVNYAQDRAPFDFDHGKSDLNIVTAGDPTGDGLKIAYQFAEHRNVLDAIMEYVRQGVADISIEVTATTRTFTVWPKSTDSRTPKLGKGATYGTTLELDVNVADFTWSWDLEQAASSVVLLGPGDGPDRPEGGATDTSLLGGAFTMEIVEQAADDITVGHLDERADERLKVAARPEILEVTTLPGAGVIGNLAVGDTVTVIIDHGWVDINAVYRAVRIEADLLKDQATISLNAVPT
jgi:hypothetical protein